jgi:hypothetical protein
LDKLRAILTHFSDEWNKSGKLHVSAVWPISWRVVNIVQTSRGKIKADIVAREG